jgi:hypothetical protein
MDVRICGGDDAQSVASGEIEVAIYIALGVDDDGLTRAGATDQIRKLRELRINNLADEHHVLPLAQGRGEGCAHLMT